jgi:cytochrome c biogenesis protein CcdA
MDPVQYSMAFTAGVLAFLSPCALPMLPAYISYYINRGEGKGSLISGLIFSLAMLFGFMAVFLIIGVVSSFLIGNIFRWIWLTTPIIGGILIILGLITGWTDLTTKLPRFELQNRGMGKYSIFLYGAGYAVASLGCSLTIFLLVVLQGAAVGGFTEILSLLLFYGAGAATLIIPLTLTLTLASSIIHENLQRLLPYMRRINSVVLIIAGTYMILYSQLL